MTNDVIRDDDDDDDDAILLEILKIIGDEEAWINSRERAKQESALYFREIYGENR